MKPIYVGETKENGKIYLDLDKENIHFIFLGGATGTGKSIFGFTFFKQLVENNNPTDIGFIFLDFTQVDFYGWKGESLLMEPTYDTSNAFEILENLAKNPNKYGNKKIFVHIEENSLAIEDNERFIKAIKDIKNNNKNVYIIYSTSRPAKKHFENLVDIMDLKVIFTTVSAVDSEVLLGNDIGITMKNFEKVLAFNNKQIFLKAFTEEEMKEAIDFSNKYC